jgi:hypothetical protein
MNGFLRVCAAAVALSGGLGRPLVGQWGVGLDLQRSAYGGTSKDTSQGPQSSVRPGEALALTLRLDRRFGRFTVALGLRYARAALQADAEDIYVGLRGNFSAVEVLPEVRFRVARSGRGATLELYGGPLIGRWVFEDVSRAVPGATAGVAGEFPIFERLALWVRAGGSVMRSIFEAAELPPEAVRRATRRSEISLGLRYGR